MYVIAIHCFLQRACKFFDKCDLLHEKTSVKFGKLFMYKFRDNLPFTKEKSRADLLHVLRAMTHLRAEDEQSW